MQPHARTPVVNCIILLVAQGIWVLTADQVVTEQLHLRKYQLLGSITHNLPAPLFGCKMGVL